MGKSSKKVKKNNLKENSSELSSVGRERKYSDLERKAAKELYYMLGENRSLEKVHKILGIHISTLKAWASEEGWYEWAISRQEEDEKLALQGKYSTQVLGLSAKAKAVLENIIERFAEKIEDADIRGSDAVNAAKELLKLVDADKAVDVTDEKAPIVIVVDRNEYSVMKQEEEKDKRKDIEIEGIN